MARRLVSKLPKAELRAAHRIYRHIRAVLREALDRGEVRASKMILNSGGIEPINEQASGVWTAYSAAIFYTGHSHETHSGTSRKVRILIDRESFEKWLVRLASDGSSPPQPHERFLLKALAKRIADRAKEKDYVPVQGTLFDVMVEVFEADGQDLSRYKFDNYFWKDFPLEGAKKPGARSADNRDLFEKDLPELRGLIRSECLSRWRSKDGLTAPAS